MRPSPAVRMSFGAAFVFSLVRLMERRLSPRGLRRLLTPFIATRVAFRHRQPSQPLPECLGGKFRATKRQQRIASLNTFLEYFPEQLGTSKWRDRLRIEGIQYLEAARTRKRPVIVAFCHFGPYSLLRYWLRAAGFPAATLVKGESKDRTAIRRLKDRFAPFPEIPTAFHREDELRDAIEFLASGNVLLSAVDIMNGKKVDLSVEQNWKFWMATGPIRMAMRHQAEMIPCSIIDEGDWHFQIRLGPPVPASLLASGDASLVGQHLLDSMLPTWRERSEQCTKEFLKKFHRTESEKMSLGKNPVEVLALDLGKRHGMSESVIESSLSERERVGVRGREI